MKMTLENTKSVNWINYRFNSQKPKTPTTGSSVVMLILVGIVHLMTVAAILIS